VSAGTMAQPTVTSSSITTTKAGLARNAITLSLNRTSKEVTLSGTSAAGSNNWAANDIIEVNAALFADIAFDGTVEITVLDADVGGVMTSLTWAAPSSAAFADLTATSFTAPTSAAFADTTATSFTAPTSAAFADVTAPSFTAPTSAAFANVTATSFTAPTSAAFADVTATSFAAPTSSDLTHVAPISGGALTCSGSPCEVTVKLAPKTGAWTDADLSVVYTFSTGAALTSVALGASYTGEALGSFPDTAETKITELSVAGGQFAIGGQVATSCTSPSNTCNSSSTITLAQLGLQTNAFVGSVDAAKCHLLTAVGGAQTGDEVLGVALAKPSTTPLGLEDAMPLSVSNLIPVSVQLKVLGSLSEPVLTILDQPKMQVGPMKLPKISDFVWSDHKSYAQASACDSASGALQAADVTTSEISTPALYPGRTADVGSYTADIKKLTQSALQVVVVDLLLENVAKTTKTTLADITAKVTAIKDEDVFTKPASFWDHSLFKASSTKTTEEDTTQEKEKDASLENDDEDAGAAQALASSAGALLVGAVLFLF